MMNSVPQGWYPMGTMFADSTNLVMSKETDHNGIPLWVRPGPEPTDYEDPNEPFFCTVCQEGVLDPEGEFIIDEDSNSTLLTCDKCDSQFNVAGGLVYYYGKEYEREMLEIHYQNQMEDWYRELGDDYC